MKKFINTILTLLILYEMFMISRNTYITWKFFKWDLLHVVYVAMVDMVFVIFGVCQDSCRLRSKFFDIKKSASVLSPC